MKHVFLSITAVLAVAAFGVGIAAGEHILPKLKSKKVLGDLVPAYEHNSPETNTLLRPAKKKTYDVQNGSVDGPPLCEPSGVACACEASGSAPDGTPDAGDGLCFSDAECTKVGNACCGNESCSDVGGDCIFQKGKFKVITGKDPQVQLVKVRCGVGTELCEDTGVPCDSSTCDPSPEDCNNQCNFKKACIDTGVFLPPPTTCTTTNVACACEDDSSTPTGTGAACTSDSDCEVVNTSCCGNEQCGRPAANSSVPGALCAQIEAINTIVDENLDKFGNITPKTCNINGTDAEGKTNYAITQSADIPCKKGKCKGVLIQPPGAGGGDPCPDADKIVEVRHVRVTDGPALETQTVLSTDLRGCCFPGVVAGGGFPITACYSKDQDVLAEMGTVTQWEP